MTIYVLLLFMLFRSQSENIDCEFKNGRYRVEYDKMFSNHPEFIAVIENDNFIQFTEEQEVHYKIIWLSGSSFRLEPTIARTEPFNELEKHLNSLGQPFYKIKRCRNKQIHFEYMRNLHITISTGKFIRIKK